MVGRNIELSERKNEDRNISDEYILEIKNLNVNMPGEEVKGINLKVKKGEILGIGGLAGQGKIGICQWNYGPI